MTQVIPAPAVPRRRGAALPAVVPVLIGVMLVIRAVQARAGASPDEGGFLLVAGQWHAGGSSLYGDYWVDRPPLLIAIFRLADLAGGLVPLRILGGIAAAVTVWLLSSASARVFGRRAATCTAVVAAALLVSPLYGAVDVNGELLALPFVALGIRAAVEAVGSPGSAVGRWSAAAAGASGIAALLVKQNMADVLVFAAVLWLVAWRRRRLSAGDLGALLGHAAAGALMTYAVVMLSAMAHGTSPLEVYDATYPFRIEAGQVIAAAGSASTTLRLHRLGLSFLLSGAPVVLLLWLSRGVVRAREPGVVAGVLALLGWSAFSVLGGGSYWLHYLIESVPAVALAAGGLSLAAPRWARGAAAVVALSAVTTVAVVLGSPTATPGTVVGRAIAVSAEPGDRIVSLFGDPDIVRSSGLSSPYPYLWSLPARTLDPRLEVLATVLSGDQPAWVVVRNTRTEDRLAEHGVLPALELAYRDVADVCGRTIYLRRDLSRPSPVGHGRCSGMELP